MRYLLLLAVLLVAVVARYPHQSLCVGVVGFACWSWWCLKSLTPTVSGGGGSYGSCRFCSYTSSTAKRVADHEAGHWVVGKALGCEPYAAQIADDGSGVTYIRGIDSARTQAVISAAGSVAEGMLNNWFFEQKTNGSRWDKSSDRFKLVASALQAEISQEQARAEAKRLVRRHMGLQREISARLIREGKIG